ncbi:MULTISPECIES: sialidase family protein [Acidobacteriaceae]|uniref:sialidase family protein n=1 Tax=Acidobacteriaceae TaxID=204434 RepID=UPI00131C3D7F|nr:MULTISPECIES: sialidase family protein [Acidobacteriaceae]MDW5267697.1 sialidase family protein [Edaphobacter sp.]
MKRKFCQILSCMLSAILLFSSSIHVWAAIDRPATMYGPLSSSPKPGSLYPRAIQLKHAGSKNGYMLATFEQYTRGVPVFPVYRSSDGGATWSHISDVIDTRNGWGMRFQPFLYELPQPLGLMPAGTILCFGNSIPHDLSKTQIDMYKSTDKGATWIFVSHIANGSNAIPDSKHSPVWEPFALLANGKLIVYYSDERRKPLHNQMIVHQSSSDGVTWGRTIKDVAIAPRERPGMPVVAKMGNGSYIMTWECVCDGTQYTSYKITQNPEIWDAPNAGTKIPGSGGTPYTVWIPSGGADGTLISVSNSSNNLFTNKSYAVSGSSWTQVGAVLGKGYSRCLVVLRDMNTLFEIGPIAQSDGYNEIRYARQLIK